MVTKMSDIKNVILITVDCLRADYVGCIGERKITPNIDKLARKSIVFTRAFANGPGTNQSFPAILTSTYFFLHGGMRLLPYYATLAEVLSNNGFKTVAFHSNPFLSKNLGWNKGFNEFYDFMDAIKSPSAFVTRQQSRSLVGKLTSLVSKILLANRSVRMQRLLKKIYYKFSHLQIPYLEGRRLNEQVVGWLEKNRDEKIFLWMHYMDPHYPYVPPEEYLLDFSSREEAFEFNLSIDYENPSRDEEVEILRKLYVGEVRYVDTCIGEFLQYLEDKNLLEDSLILLTGDHGHAFMEHGRFGHAYDILYNEVLHVPLIFHGLGFSKNVDTFVQLLDVPPTVVDVFGIKKPRDFMGESLLPIIEGSEPVIPIFSESAKPDLVNLRYNLGQKVISCIWNGYKLVINKLRNTTELYDINMDFEERKNLVGVEVDVYNDLRSLIEKHLDRVAFSRKMLNLKRKI